MDKVYKAVAKDDLKLPDNPFIRWIKGNEYTLTDDGAKLTLSSESGDSYYVSEVFEELKKLFDISNSEVDMKPITEKQLRRLNKMSQYIKELNVNCDFERLSRKEAQKIIQKYQIRIPRSSIKGVYGRDAFRK